MPPLGPRVPRRRQKTQAAEEVRDGKGKEPTKGPARPYWGAGIGVDDPNSGNALSWGLAGRTELLTAVDQPSDLSTDRQQNDHDEDCGVAYGTGVRGDRPRLRDVGDVVCAAQPGRGSRDEHENVKRHVDKRSKEPIEEVSKQPRRQFCVPRVRGLGGDTHAWPAGLNRVQRVRVWRVALRGTRIRNWRFVRCLMRALPGPRGWWLCPAQCAVCVVGHPGVWRLRCRRTCRPGMFRPGVLVVAALTEDRAHGMSIWGSMSADGGSARASA